MEVKRLKKIKLFILLFYNNKKINFKILFSIKEKKNSKYIYFK